jgi:trehalose-phosphatase
MESVTKRRTDTLPSAVERFEEIAERLEGMGAALFLDYDGTLTPIVDRPEDAHLPLPVQGILKALSERCVVAIISGRDLHDVQSRVGIRNLFYAGSHGFEIAGPEGMLLHNQQGSDYLPALAKAEKVLRDRLHRVCGAQVERKRFGIAVHYRNVAAKDRERVGGIVQEVADSFPVLRRSEGKRVYELQPGIEWNKGAALMWLLDSLHLDGPDVLSLYVGDDATDEDAFEVVSERGVGIVVEEASSRETFARYVLANTEEVSRFLEKLLASLSGETSGQEEEPLRKGG